METLLEKLDPLRLWMEKHSVISNIALSLFASFITTILVLLMCK